MRLEGGWWLEEKGKRIKELKSVNEKCCLPYQLTKDAASVKPSATSAPTGEPWGNSGWWQMGCLLPSPQPLQPPPRVQPEGTQNGKEQDTGLRELRCISKEWFQWAQILHLPIHRKALHSLTWDVWFSLINSHLLVFWPPGLCYKNSYVSWLHPAFHLQSHLPVIWDAGSQA